MPLWDEGRVAITEDFVNSKPLMVEVGERFACFERTMEAINSAPARHVIGCFQINFSESLLEV